MYLPSIHLYPCQMPDSKSPNNLAELCGSFLTRSKMMIGSIYVGSFCYKAIPITPEKVSLHKLYCSAMLSTFQGPSEQVKSF